jgi:hypothetical protein
VCAGDDCLSLVERERHGDPLNLSGQLSLHERAYRQRRRQRKDAKLE